MPSPTPLPDPQWTEGPLECVGCGYSLDGLAIPGRCPECGAPFDSQVMVLHGVARSSSGTSLWRRLAWIGLAVGAMIVTQAWPFLLMFSWMVLVAALVAVLAGIIFMVATGRRERAGTERFMFTSAGVARLPAKRDDRGPGMDAVFIPYSPTARLRVDPISPFWRRVRIETPDTHGVHQVVFDAGFRCPSQHADRVEATIRAAMQGTAMPTDHPTAPPLHPPVTPPPLPR